MGRVSMGDGVDINTRILQRIAPYLAILESYYMHLNTSKGEFTKAITACGEDGGGAAVG